MAKLYLLLVTTAILIQYAVSRGPIRDIEEEWTDYEATLRDPAYRLPTNTRPEHYDVTLTPYFENVPDGGEHEQFSFDGTVAIHLNVVESGENRIVMHCNDLTIRSLSLVTLVDNEEVPVALVDPNVIPQCEAQYNFLTINTVEPLVLDQKYIARMAFEGHLQTNMRGFYRSWYIDSSGVKRWMATTQFQPGHARQAFPCYDEPGFKATFIITINRELDFSPTISNMPIDQIGPCFKTSGTVTVLPPPGFPSGRQSPLSADGNSEAIPNEWLAQLRPTDGRIAETFHITPIMSTYLIAFIVSHYIKVSSDTSDTTRPFDIYARDNAGLTGDWSLDVGVRLLAAMEEFTGIPYYTMQDHIDMKQAAIPDFSAGAMENWGLLTYREALILYDPENSNHFYKQRVANIVAHEITHMWFGNLVTCAWWDNLWLNEGFARFYTYFLAQTVLSELGFDIRFIDEQVHVAMFADSIDSAHALTDPNVNSPTTVSNHFSTITYARGASVLRMTQYLLGKETYDKGLRFYLDERKFDVADPDDLFNALDHVAQEDGALSQYREVTVSSYFKTWSEQAGHPLLTVSVDQRTGEMTIVQERWERNTGQSGISTLYHVPITWTRGGQPDFEDLKPSAVLTGYSSMVQRGSQGLEWVIFNKQQTGFYRVNYDDDSWGLITLALRGDDRVVIHEINRGQIVDDLFALARAGVNTYISTFNVLSFLEFEDAYAPWLAAISGFNFVRRRLAHDADNLEKLHEMLIQLSTAVTARLGYQERQDEPYMDGLLRMYLMRFLCDVGHDQCVSTAIASFRAYRDQEEFIPANMRPWVYCTGLRNGNAADFDALWDKYMEDDLAGEKIVLLETLGCTRDAASLRKYLDHIVSDNDEVRPQDFNTALNSATSGNEENTKIVFDWLKENLVDAREALGGLSNLLSYISGRLITNEDIIEFEEWVQANQDELQGAYNTGINGVTSARNNLQWTSERLPELADYLENGYQEVDLDNGIEPTTEPSTTPDSAHIFGLAYLTVIVTIAFHFVF